MQAAQARPRGRLVVQGHLVEGPGVAEIAADGVGRAERVKQPTGGKVLPAQVAEGVMEDRESIHWPGVVDERRGAQVGQRGEQNGVDLG